jgi:hypothetical protein
MSLLKINYRPLTVPGAKSAYMTQWQATRFKACSRPFFSHLIRASLNAACAGPVAVNKRNYAACVFAAGDQRNNNEMIIRLISGVWANYFVTRGTL